MHMLIFDTLQYVKTLTSAGIPNQQAEALTNAQKVVFEEVIDNTIATKSDFAELKAELKHDMYHIQDQFNVLATEVKSIKWMLGIVMGATFALFIRSFF